MTCQPFKLLIDTKSSETVTPNLRTADGIPFDVFPATPQTVESTLEKVMRRQLLVAIRRAVEKEYLYWIEELVEQPNNSAKRLIFRTNIADQVGEFRHSGVISEYRVVCDESNNPKDVQDLGAPTVLVGVKLTKCENHCEILLRPIIEQKETQDV